VLVSVLAVGATLAGCGDDDASAVGSTKDWCALVEDIDVSFNSTDNSSDPFDVKQGEYAVINAKLDDLTDGLDVVPEESRDAVGQSIAWATKLTDVLVDVENEEEASELLFGENGVFAEEEGIDPAGAAWILETCGVDIDGDES
jgi:hypothetical protein